ncbi:MAG: ATP-binding cassette domain-containing protein [Verrucomicrobiia bacterium]|jgi:phospholipid/cholesterol/gamma-HCH transport system ATP-binding protein
MKHDTPATVIEVKNLTCGYGETVVLQKASFSVRAQELFFVIGGSGCGKSTLLRCMIGLLKPTQGDVAYFGKSFTQCETLDRRDILKSFGVLYQNNALWSSMTLSENVSLPLEEYTSLTRRDREEIVALKLTQVGLSGSGNLFPSELSGGMKKRAALARALALDPAIVFFDEPSTGLDPITSRAMDQLILQVRETLGTTMVIVSHQLSSIFRLADHAIFLDREVKGIIAEGAPAELAATSTDPRVREFLKDEDSPKQTHPAAAKQP